MARRHAAGAGLSARYDRASGFKERYDILRLEILRQFDGVIIDMDVEAIRPLDPLLRGVEAFVGRIGRNHVGNQVLGAVPRHLFFELAVASCDGSALPFAQSKIRHVTPECSQLRTAY